MSGFLDILKRFGPARLGAMGAVTLALVAFFAFVIMRVTQPTYAILFTDLDVRDSSAIVKKLEAAGVPYELGGDGSSIRVPEPQVASLRMSMAGDGLPSGGGIGYEIFDKGDSLSATSFVQNINGLRALEGELARTIRSIDRVEGARVHLVIPEKALFQRDRQEPSASIALKVRGGLEPGQIRAIRHLVASAVEGLKAERISIVDEQGSLLADGASDANADSGADDRKLATERRLTDQLTGIVESVVGAGRARVQVAAELDLRRLSETQDVFDPDSKVVRSSQTTEESQVSAGQPKDQGVTVGNELPNASGQSSAGQVQDQSKKTQETTNYEISRTTRTQQTDPGGLKRVSVAVLVDGVYGKDSSGAATYQPRPKEELDRIAVLVRSAIGFDQGRGDQVEVVNLRFAEGPPPAAVSEPGGLMSLLQFTRDQVMRLVELGVLGVLSILVLLVVVRPLVKKVIAPEPLKLEGPAGAFATAHGGGTAIAGAEAPKAAANDEATLKSIEIAQINGSVQQKSIERIGELVEANPTETMSLIRTWINEKAAA